MKRLLLLLTVAMVTSANVGCFHWRHWRCRRGTPCATCPPAAGVPFSGNPYMTPPSVFSGAEVIIPAPTAPVPVTPVPTP